jgi:hypothetical protein
MEKATGRKHEEAVGGCDGLHMDFQYRAQRPGSPTDVVAEFEVTLRTCCGHPIVVLRNWILVLDEKDGTYFTVPPGECWDDADGKEVLLESIDIFPENPGDFDLFMFKAVEGYRHWAGLCGRDVRTEEDRAPSKDAGPAAHAGPVGQEGPTR